MLDTIVKGISYPIVIPTAMYLIVIPSLALLVACVFSFVLQICVLFDLRLESECLIPAYFPSTLSPLSRSLNFRLFRRFPLLKHLENFASFAQPAKLAKFGLFPRSVNGRSQYIA